jgi:hypothetical protein
MFCFVMYPAVLGDVQQQVLQSSRVLAVFVPAQPAVYHPLSYCAPRTANARCALKQWEPAEA